MPSTDIGHDASMPTEAPPTDRTRVRRKAERGRYDRATVDAILDEALLVPRRIRRRRTSVGRADCLCSHRRSRVCPRSDRQLRTAFARRWRRGVHHRHAARRPRAVALGVPPLDELPVGDAVRHRRGSARRGRQALRRDGDPRTPDPRTQRRHQSHRRSRSCGRPSSCGCRSTRCRPRFAPARPSRTTTTSGSTTGPASCR